jgi:hypothetical protein
LFDFIPVIAYTGVAGWSLPDSPYLPFPIFEDIPMDICLSPARAAASRTNGAKSRGPKTLEGKARSARNALKHGMRAQQCIVLPGERASAFEAFEAALLQELAPEGALQAVLAQRVVAASWRLARAERLEAELFARNMLDGGGLGLALIRDCNGARAFDTLLRYRGGTLAELWRALRTLKALQAEQAACAEAREGAREPAAPPESPLPAEPRGIPTEPESRGNLDRCAPPPAASVPAALSCSRAATRTRLPDEPERRANLGNSARPDDRAVPERGQARRAEPAPCLPIERAQRPGAAALLAGTALPFARRTSP